MADTLFSYVERLHGGADWGTGQTSLEGVARAWIVRRTLWLRPYAVGGGLPIHDERPWLREDR